jgi:proteasome accessory factor B
VSSTPELPSSNVAVRRLLNLTLALMATSTPMTVADVITRVEGYGGDPTSESERRKFERDKKRLRDSGIPIRTSGEHNDERGYRIPVDTAVLPPLALTDGEAAALALVAQSWSQGTLAALADRALAQLEAAGRVHAPAPRLLLQPKLDGEGPALEELLPAHGLRRVVRFTYRSVDGEVTERTLEPWGVVSWRRRWYVTGFDRDRRAQRTFRLSRIVDQRVRASGEPEAFVIPADVDVRAQLDAFRHEDPVGVACVHVRPGAALALRARGRATGEVVGGRDVYEVDYANVTDHAGWLRTFAGDALPVAPPELVRDVHAGWAALAGDPT